MGSENKNSYMNATKDKLKSKEIIQKILKDTYFTEFTFNTGFILRFNRDEPTEYEGKKIPTEFYIDIISNWWFGSESEWMETLKKFADNRYMAEPKEPVLSYELTRLRWTEGAIVDEVQFWENYMTILFKNGDSISVSYYAEMDYAWIISESNKILTAEKWEIICDNGDFFINVPNI